MEDLQEQIIELGEVVKDLKDKLDEYPLGSLEDEMKEEWWEEVKNKYTLKQLEDFLGNRFNLKTKPC